MSDRTEKTEAGDAERAERMKVRVIGIDFGTSTSLIRIRTYEDQEEGEQQDISQYVEFDGRAVVPTLIRMDGKDAYYGYDAQPERLGSVLYTDFKLRLESSWDDKREQARELTERFLKYMYRKYAEQEAYFGECDQIRTLISYPAKWKAETAAFMVAAAGKAGFPNVEGMDEAAAAMCAVHIQYGEFLKKNGLYAEGAFHALLIDMGAGTTDLALCRYSGEGNEILCTWPSADAHLFFGGNEMDVLLRDYLGEYLKDNGIAPEITEKFIQQNKISCKQWKEDTVSKLLGSGEAVTSCSFAAGIFPIWNTIPRPFPALDRKRLQEISSGYLHIFTELVKGMTEEAIARGFLKGADEIRLILLTGGHSQWYFVKEILLDRLEGLPRLHLETIQKQPERILQMARPHETVGCGLVWWPYWQRKQNTFREDESVNPTRQKNEKESIHPSANILPEITESMGSIIQRAKEGDARAQYLAGCAYQKGEGVMINPAAAKYWWRESAIQGNTLAMWKYGYHMRKEGDRQEGVLWIVRAAEDQHLEAQLYLAYHAELFKDRFFWSRKVLARQDLDMEAMYETGVPSGNNSVDNVRKGSHLISELQTFAGECFFFGLGTYRDYSQAFAYFEEAAAKISDPFDPGAKKACVDLGLCYQFGKGTQQDLLHAKSMYGFVKIEKEFPLLGLALEAWTPAGERRTAYLEEEEFRAYFAARFPQSLWNIPQEEWRVFSSSHLELQKNEEVYLLKSVSRREQLLGKPVHTVTAVTNLRVFSFTVSENGLREMQWGIPYEVLDSARIQGKITKNTALYPVSDAETGREGSAVSIIAPVKEPWFADAVNLLIRRKRWSNREGIYQI